MTCRFICDRMLGTLCKYLRMSGFDTAYARDSKTALVSALQEDRVLLTRNTRMRGQKHVFFITADAPHEQLRSVYEHFCIHGSMNFLGRCLLCNEPLKKAAKEDIRKLVPFFTYNNFDEFAQCPKCRRVYWKGSHYQKMKRDIETTAP
ncbi:MAG TPA: Mut7-C RNAse domain-containing protein [bacterium]